jgi:hypothetical protein
MFCVPVLIFSSTEGVGCRFHVLPARTRFRRYRGRRVPFSCLARPESFSAVPRQSDPFIMFCALGLVFGRTEGVRSRLHVLRSWTRFRRYRGRRLPFSSFASPDSFSAVPWASAPVFMFFARTRFWLYRGSQIPFSCFARPDSFSAVPRVSGPVFMFYAPVLIFCGTEGVGSRFHDLRARTHFLHYRGRQVPFSFLRAQIRFRLYRGRRFPFSSFCALGLVFGLPEGVWSSFHVLRSQTRFRRYRGRRVLF